MKKGIRFKRDMSQQSILTPIFVFGKQRSGTTWLTNILESHRDIYTPTHIEHYGQKESFFFTKILPYCNHGRTKEDLFASHSIFIQSDFFHLLDLSPENLMDIGRQGPYRYFEDIMNKASIQKGAKCWVEKTPSNTLIMKTICEEYNNAIFIVVKRDIEEVIISSRIKESEYNLLSLMRQVISYNLYYSIASIYEEICLKVDYTDLINRYEETVEEIFRYIGVSYNTIPKSNFRKNSSFETKKIKNVITLNPFERLIVFSISVLFKIIPARLIEKLYLLWFFTLKKFKLHYKMFYLVLKNLYR